MMSFNQSMMDLNCGKGTYKKLKKLSKKKLNKCKANYYKDNSVVTRAPLVCHGGFGNPRCKYYEGCLKDYGIKLSKNGRRIKQGHR